MYIITFLYLIYKICKIIPNGPKDQNLKKIGFLYYINYGFKWTFAQLVIYTEIIKQSLKLIGQF